MFLRELSRRSVKGSQRVYAGVRKSISWHRRAGKRCNCVQNAARKLFRMESGLIGLLATGSTA